MYVLPLLPRAFCAHQPVWVQPDGRMHSEDGQACGPVRSAWCANAGSPSCPAPSARTFAAPQRQQRVAGDARGSPGNAGTSACANPRRRCALHTRHASSLSCRPGGAHLQRLACPRHSRQRRSTAGGCADRHQGQRGEGASAAGQGLCAQAGAGVQARVHQPCAEGFSGPGVRTVYGGEAARVGARWMWCGCWMLEPACLPDAWAWGITCAAGRHRFTMLATTTTTTTTDAAMPHILEATQVHSTCTVHMHSTCLAPCCLTCPAAHACDRSSSIVFTFHRISW